MARLLTPVLSFLAACALTADAAQGQSSDWTVVGGFHLGKPGGASIAFGVARVMRHRTTPQGWHQRKDVFLLAEPGTRGGRLSLGYTEYERTDEGWAIATVRASYLRRWTARSRRAYAGLEVGVSGLPLPTGIRIGEFIGLRSHREEKRSLFAIDWAIGW